MAIRIVHAIFWLFEILIFARVLLSWMPHDRHRPPLDLLYRITDPLILTCREILYSIYKILNLDERRMPFDLSPLLALAFIYALQQGIVWFIRILAA